MLFGRLGSYNYSAIHVQVNSIPKGVQRKFKTKGLISIEGHPLQWRYFGRIIINGVVVLINGSQDRITPQMILMTSCHTGHSPVKSMTYTIPKGPVHMRWLNGLSSVVLRSRLENFQPPERQEKFLRRKMRKLSIKVTSLAKYFAGAERNDKVENGLWVNEHIA